MSDFTLAAFRPDWPAPAHVQALCTTRGHSPDCGASTGPYAFFNLGDHVGDAPQAVAANRARLSQALQARAVFMQQVHGTQVLLVQADTPDGLRADAAVTALPGLACTVMVADCLPVLLCSATGRAVAAAHAGWRGLAEGVLERTVAALKAQLPPGDCGTQLMAWLGPCISPAVFEIGPEVRQALLAADPQASCCFAPQPAGKYLADLPALARRRLHALGVQNVYGNDGSLAWCTVRQAKRYFSYRRDQAGGSGRMAACIALV